MIAGIRQYLGGWPGVGRIVAGMARHQYDLQLTRFGQDGWSATFYPAGIAHSLTPMVGSGWAREPWTAVQRAAWEALRRREADREYDTYPERIPRRLARDRMCPLKSGSTPRDRRLGHGSAQRHAGPFLPRVRR